MLRNFNIKTIYSNWKKSSIRTGLKDGENISIGLFYSKNNLCLFQVLRKKRNNAR